MWFDLFNTSNKWVLYTLAIDIILYLLLPLEAYGVASRDVIYPLIWISIFVIGITLLYQEQNFALMLILTIIYFVLTCILSFFFFGLCRWGHHGQLYKNKKDESISIICQTYDCYGTAEECRLYKQKELFTDVYWITTFDGKDIDSTVWQRKK